MSYLEFFFLQENPFGETPNPRFYFPALPHEDALRQLSWALDENKGFLLVSGEAGSGKTTLSRVIYSAYRGEANFAFVVNPAADDRELLRMICRDFGLALPPGVQPDLDFLNQGLLASAQAGRRNILFVDEAQGLSDTALEFIRLLTNLETNSRKLLQVVLLAQPELEARLDQPELRQLGQRIFLRTHIPFLSLAETDAYIRHRLELSGSGNFVRFDLTAVKRIHKITGGAPRLINKACELALRFAAKERTRLIDSALMRSLPFAEVGLSSRSSRWIEILRGGLSK